MFAVVSLALDWIIFKVSVWSAKGDLKTSRKGLWGFTNCSRDRRGLLEHLLMIVDSIGSSEGNSPPAGAPSS